MSVTVNTTNVTYNDGTTHTSGKKYSPVTAYPGSNIQRTWAHGMGQTPSSWGAVVVLTVATNSCPVGTSFAFTSYDGDGGRQNSVYADATNVGYFGSNVYVRGFDGNNIAMTSAIANMYFWAQK